MSIKDKPLKKCHSDARITIAVIHNDIISDYTKEKAELKRKLKIEKDEEKKQEIQNKIEEINVNINNYYLKNGLLLNDYYNRDFNTSKPVEKNNILDFFKKEDDKGSETEKEKPVEKKDDIIITYLANVNDCYLNDSK